MNNLGVILEIIDIMLSIKNIISIVLSEDSLFTNNLSYNLEQCMHTAYGCIIFHKFIEKMTKINKKKLILKKYKKFGKSNVMRHFVRDGLPSALQLYKKMSLNYCFHCSDQIAIYMCGGCNNAQYCSKECQSNNWHIHSKTCCVGNLS